MVQDFVDTPLVLARPAAGLTLRHAVQQRVQRRECIDDPLGRIWATGLEPFSSR
jgi:hypothetical protein